MRRIIFYMPRINAGEFERQAARAAALWGCDGDDLWPLPPGEGIDHLRREVVLAALDRYDPGEIDVCGFFCHGTARWVQAGFKMSNVHLLSDALSRVMAPGGCVALYCCLTGDDGDGIAHEQGDEPQTEGGLADALSTACPDVRVLCHETKGHTVWNPYVIELQHGIPRYIMEPRAHGWETWCNQLRTTDLALSLATARTVDFTEGEASDVVNDHAGGCCGNHPRGDEVGAADCGVCQEAERAEAPAQAGGDAAEG